MSMLGLGMNDGQAALASAQGDVKVSKEAKAVVPESGSARESPHPVVNISKRMKSRTVSDTTRESSHQNAGVMAHPSGTTSSKSASSSSMLKLIQ